MKRNKAALSHHPQPVSNTIHPKFEQCTGVKPFFNSLFLFFFFEVASYDTQIVFKQDVKKKKSHGEKKKGGGE